MVLAFGCVLLLGGCGGDVTFDAAEWKAESGGGTRCEDDSVPHKRKEMIDDLLDEHLKLGMPQAAVRNLLGLPEERSVDKRGVWWSYYTGSDGLDCILLTVRFRASRLVQAYEGQT